jgi:hypothetical protein
LNVEVRIDLLELMVDLKVEMDGEVDERQCFGVECFEGLVGV